ncbi:MAG: hypothetical protein N7Q72_00470 [Spiroplasma sp. Tabriz.8]|nr:hypothetical protein [Spiroplasma sp. Tabriz.8]
MRVFSNDTHKHSKIIIIIIIIIIKETHKNYKLFIIIIIIIIIFYNRGLYINSSNYLNTLRIHHANQFQVPQVHTPFLKI